MFWGKVTAPVLGPALSSLIPERVVETGGLEGAIGLRLRARFIGDLLIDEPGGWRKLFLTRGRNVLTGRWSKRNVRFHARLLCYFYDLGSLNTSEGQEQPQ
jgi:hypothetical protein